MEEFEIHDIEMTEDEYSRSGKWVTVNQTWEGTICRIGDGQKLKFSLNHSYDGDNGGDTAKILSKKPNKFTEVEWDKLKQEMTEYIEDDYCNDRMGWEEINMS